MSAAAEARLLQAPRGGHVRGRSLTGIAPVGDYWRAAVCMWARLFLSECLCLPSVSAAMGGCLHCLDWMTI